MAKSEAASTGKLTTESESSSGRMRVWPLEALNLVEQRADGKFSDWWRSLEYARCLIATSNFDVATTTYQEFLKTGIPACSVEEVLFYLDDFLQVFPECDAARKVIAMLQGYLAQLDEE